VSIERLIQEGAEVVGGVAYLDRKEVGQFSAGQFVANAHGSGIIAECLARDAIIAGAAHLDKQEVLTTTPQSQNRARKPKAETPAAPAPVETPAEAPVAAPVAPAIPVEVPVAPLPKALQAEADMAAGLLAGLASLGVDSGTPQ
jgi:hypothetical protein